MANKVYYQYQVYKIGPYNCVSIDARDKILALAKGWIFIANEEGTRIGVVTCHSSKGESKKYYDFNTLFDHVTVLGEVSRVRQLQLANNPDLRYINELS